MNLRRIRIGWCAVALMLLDAASARANGLTPSSSQQARLTVFSETCAFVPDPIQAPAALQFEAGLAVSRGEGPFLRLRFGGATRSLGTDLLGVVEGGVGAAASWGLVGDFAVGVGGRQQFTAGDLYVVEESGTVERTTDFGTTLGLVTVNAGVGYDFRGISGPPLRILLGPRIQLTIPQRDQAAVELGMGVRLAWVL